MGFTLGELARCIGGELRGNPDCRITAVASLRSAGEGAISFLANARYRKYLRATRASAVIVTAEHAAESPTATLTVADPYTAYARIAGLLYPAKSARRGRHPDAIVGDHCRIDDSAWIGPGCIIEDEADIGAGVQLGAGCFVGRGSRIGANSVLHARVVVCEAVSIGERALVHPGVVIGSDGFGHAEDDGKWLKVPQLGGVWIGADVEIGANTTIDRGALEDTVVEDGVKLDNQVHVAHNVHIGAHTAIAACTGISGSARIGSHCRIGGGVGVLGHLEIADHVTVTAMTMVARSINAPGVYSSGLPAQDNTAWNRNVGNLRRLAGLARRLYRLEKYLTERIDRQRP
jgi:UDP-3-O-[3-hydroxymyristoyl] glucosamine N-acyltransferase